MRKYNNGLSPKIQYAVKYNLALHLGLSQREISKEFAGNHVRTLSPLAFGQLRINTH